MSNQATLLLPCAGRSSRYPGTRPKWMLTTPEGRLALEWARESVPTSAVSRVVAGFRREHDEAFDVRGLMARAFGNSVDIVIIDRDTRGPADTVAEMVRRAGVSGPILIKDADSFFSPAPVPAGSFVSLSNLADTPDMANVGAKSFAVLNGSDIVVELVEKSVVSPFVCVGLYGVSDAALFLDAFGTVSDLRSSGEIFVSHVLNRAILDGEIVSPHFVSGLIDVGTIADWQRFTRTRGTLIADLDGVVFRNHSKYFPPFWDDADEPIAENVAELLDWQRRGAQLVFMTARPEAYRAKTEAALRAVGFEIHALVMGCRHGRRILINDHARSNPYPAAVGISVGRDAPELSDMLASLK